MTSPFARSSVFAAVLLTACAASSPPARYVVATLEPTRGNNTAGTIFFAQDGGMVQVSGRVSGLRPNQEHGFHVHEKGDCSSGDGESAGGHFNPDGKRHGPPQAEHHAGDVPSLKADAAGNAVVNVRVAGNVLGAGGTDLVGKGLIVHANPDDYVTQPTGNAGARLACGVIGTVPGKDGNGRDSPLPAVR